MFVCGEYFEAISNVLHYMACDSSLFAPFLFAVLRIFRIFVNIENEY